MSDSRDAPASLLEPLCSLCSSPLALVLQGYAPVQQCARRLLLVYTCVTPACASANKGAGVWKAVRWQKSDGNDAKQKPEFSSSTQHDESASWEEDASTTVPPGNESWGGDDGNFFGANDDDASWGGGGGGASWGGGGEQTEEDGGALATEFQKQATIAETQPAQHITTTTTTTTTTAKTAKTRKGDEHSVRDVEGHEAVSSAPCFAEFHLFAVEEPTSNANVEDSAARRAKELLCEYERAQQKQDDAAAHEYEHTQQKDNGSAAQQPSGDPKEGYERDTLAHPRLAAAMGKSLRFHKRLMRVPGQCARYHAPTASPEVQATPLWPYPDRELPPTPPPCAHCGATMQFELQLCPALIGHLSDAREWPGRCTGPHAIAPPDDWAWSAVCVFTCTCNLAQDGWGVGEACTIAVAEDGGVEAALV